MKVELIRHTPEPEKTIYLAARSCYSLKSLRGIESEFSKEKLKEMLKHTILSGHHSVLEHASFTFSIEGVSRVLLAQLTRHRIASYSVQSQRYVKFEKIEFTIPPSIKEKPQMEWIFNQLVEMSKRYYDELLANEIPPEDARYILPQCVVTKLVMTMNARELLHFFKLRLCNRAQWEIRDLAHAMLKEVSEVSPDIFYFAGPSCKVDVCKEMKPCGKPWPKLQL